MWEGCEEEGRGVERVVLVTEGGRHIRSQLCEREDHSKASLSLLHSILSLQFFCIQTSNFEYLLSKSLVVLQEGSKGCLLVSFETVTWKADAEMRNLEICSTYKSSCC